MQCNCIVIVKHVYSKPDLIMYEQLRGYTLTMWNVVS